MSSQSMQNLIKMMKLNPTKLSFADGTDFAMCRKIHDMQSDQIPIDSSISVEKDILGGVEVERLTPKDIKSKTILLQIHGGGFCFGSTVSGRSYAAKLAFECGLITYTVNYGLAPEKPFPAAPNDCYNVYKALTEKYPDCEIALLGESAGATLCLVVALMAKDKKIKKPCCVCSYAPCVDFANDLPSRTQNAQTDLLLPANTLQEMRRLYAVDADLKNPYLSPIFGDFKDFPPLKLVADNGELLADDTRILAEKAKECGVEVEYEMFDGTFHTFPAMGRMTEEGARVMDETVKFIEKYSR